MTESQKIKAIMKECGCSLSDAKEILCVREGFTDDDGIKFIYDEKKERFVGKDKNGEEIHALI